MSTLAFLVNFPANYGYDYRAQGRVALIFSATCKAGEGTEHVQESRIGIRLGIGFGFVLLLSILIFATAAVRNTIPFNGTVLGVRRAAAWPMSFGRPDGGMIQLRCAS
jgi:hypothetical protein